jgi:hypothetical protein
MVSNRHGEATVESVTLLFCVPECPPPDHNAKKDRGDVPFPGRKDLKGGGLGSGSRTGFAGGSVRSSGGGPGRPETVGEVHAPLVLLRTREKALSAMGKKAT